MNSAEIRQAIKLTMDLAPAIMRAAEIVDAAEIAEQTVADCEQRKRRIERDIAELERTAGERAAEVGLVQRDLDQAKLDAQAETEKLNAVLRGVQAKVEQAQAVLDSTRNDHAVFLQSIEAEIIVKKSELEGLRNEMDLLVSRLRA